MSSYTSEEKAGRGECGAQVICAWCGGVIRAGAAKAARRMCQECFVRMMREHSRAHRRDSGRRHASDR